MTVRKFNKQGIPSRASLNKESIEVHSMAHHLTITNDADGYYWRERDKDLIRVLVDWNNGVYDKASREYCEKYPE